MKNLDENRAWARTHIPPSRGLSGLRAKLRKAQDEENAETRLLGVLAASLALGLFFAWESPDLRLPIDPLKIAHPGEITLAEGQAAKIDGMPPGIRFYWVLK